MSDEADIVTIVSSDLIATVMEDYFNKKMYKLPVHIVELKPTEAGYSFFLQFVTKKPTFPNLSEGTKLTAEEMQLVKNGSKPVTIRDNKGKFTKRDTV